MNRIKEVLSQVRWFKAFLLLLSLVGATIGYDGVARYIRIGLKAGLQEAFNAPAEVSYVVWTPSRLIIKRIAVVDRNGEEYSFVAREMRAEISFDHFIRKSLVFNDMNLDLSFNESIPEEKRAKYKKDIAEFNKQQELQKEERKKKAEKAKADIKEEIKKVWTAYIEKKKKEILVYEDQVKEISSDIKTLKASSSETLSKIDPLASEFKDLGERIEKAYKAEDYQKLLVLAKELDAKRTKIQALKEEFKKITRESMEIKDRTVETKEDITAYVDNIRNNYTSIIMEDLGFVMGEIPSLSKVFAAKDLLEKYEKYYTYYLKYEDFRKKYIKEKKKKEKKREEEKPGTDYEFHLDSPTPAFWIRNATFTFKDDGMEYSIGLENIITSYEGLSQNSSVKLSGKGDDREVALRVDFRPQLFSGSLKAKGFNVSGMDLNALVLESASTDYNLDFSFAPVQSISLHADVKDAEFSGNDNLLKFIAGIDSFYLKAEGKKGPEKWDLTAESDLDQKIGDNLKKEFEKQKAKGTEYLNTLFSQWYESNIPATYDLLGENSDKITSLLNETDRQGTLDKVSADLKLKLRGYLDELKKDALKDGLDSLFK